MTRVSTSQAIFIFIFAILALILLNGYAQNLVADYRANTWLVLLGTFVGMIALVLVARGRLAIEWDAWELFGFSATVISVWLYFVLPALPTLLPPTQSSDAVRHYLQAMFSYPEGKLVSWYPAGGAFIVANFARWLFVDPLRVLHPVAASFVALSAGAVYGIACTILRATRAQKILALIAPALLFVPWSYFAGIIMGEQYFFAQAFAHYFILAAFWFTASYAARPHPIFAGLIGVALLGVVVAYPILIPLPLALFALIVGAQILTPSLSLQGRGRKRAILILAIFFALMLGIGIALERGGILELRTAQVSASSEVGEGGVTTPSLDALGGAIFLLLALAGIPVAWRAGNAGKTLVAFLIAWVLQFIAFIIAQSVIHLSAYRVDKTFYILAFPLALCAALFSARVLARFSARLDAMPRAAMLALIVIASAGILIARPPRTFALFTESELQAALWAKQNLDTYHIAYLDPNPVRAYWLAFGLWREMLPNEWFQWIPAGAKLGPKNFTEWQTDPAWHRYVLVKDLPGFQDLEGLHVVHQIGASAILEKNVPRIAAPIPSRPDVWYFDSTLKLLGYDLARTTFAPGETITLTMYTESIYPPYATVAWRIELLDRAGNVVSKVERDPFANKFPVQRWHPGEIARDEWSLAFPANAAPGVYDVRMSLFRRASGEVRSVFRIASSGAVQQHLDAAPIARVKIPLPPPSADEQRAMTRLAARVGDAFKLLGYAIQSRRGAPTIELALYWQSIAPTEKDFTVFAHLLDASGTIIAQSDAMPGRGAYPTSIWDAGEIVKDTHALALSANARAPFSLVIGMYDAEQKRLPIGGSDKLIVDFRLQISD